MNFVANWGFPSVSSVLVQLSRHCYSEMIHHCASSPSPPKHTQNVNPYLLVLLFLTWSFSTKQEAQDTLVHVLICFLVVWQQKEGASGAGRKADCHLLICSFPDGLEEDGSQCWTETLCLFVTPYHLAQFETVVWQNPLSFYTHIHTQKKPSVPALINEHGWCFFMSKMHSSMSSFLSHLFPFQLLFSQNLQPSIRSLTI